MNSLSDEFIYEYNIMNSGHMNSYMNTLYELVTYEFTYACMNSKKKSWIHIMNSLTINS